MQLHHDDQRALAFEFTKNDDAEDRDHKIADALGLDLVAARSLVGAVVADLTWPTEGTRAADGTAFVDEDRFGIGWWKGYCDLGTSRRLLIGDYLIEVSEAIQTNLLETRLHLSAFRASLENVPATPFLTNPLSQLHATFAEMQTAGMLRAAISTVDCVAAAAIGVLGLPLLIKRGDLGTVQVWLRDKAPKLQPSVSLTFQVAKLQAIVDAFERSPSGWLRWATTYRHAFVHRGRRTRTWHPGVGLRLAGEPDRSEVESRLAGPYPESLHEPAMVTLEGVMANLQGAAVEACTILRAAWQERRADPAMIVQPKEQWKDSPPIEAGVPFKGFAPRELVPVHAVVVHPKEERRMRAAALDARLIHLWRGFT